MDDTKKEQLKTEFLEIMAPLIKNKYTNFKTKALYDEISKEWIVALYFKRAGILDSLVIASGEEKIAKEAEEVIDKIISENFSSPEHKTKDILKL